MNSAVNLSGRLLVIALSARPFVAAAKRAGYVVTAIDAFADQQTVELADATIIVDYDKYGFKPDALLSAIGKLDASQYIGFVYGSGFEAQPALLQKIADIMPLIGNTPATVYAIKNVHDFFAALQQYNIAYPETYARLPRNHHAEPYLQKFAGGCGGMHISLAPVDTELTKADAELAPDHYYQQHITGRSVSLLFIAESQHIAVIGFNEQWLSPSSAIPFRYGGAASNIKLPQIIQQQLMGAAAKLTKKFGLLGLNSLDAIVRDDVAYVLETNPRLSATVDLYDDLNLLDWHIRACQHINQQQANPRSSQTVPKLSKAHAIVYAVSDVIISATFDWPDWVVDNPHGVTQYEAIKVLAGEPVCTVLAVADNAESAKQIAQIRVKIMQQLLQEI